LLIAGYALFLLGRDKHPVATNVGTV
jgi:hypothetical protein